MWHRPTKHAKMLSYALKFIILLAVFGIVQCKLEFFDMPTAEFWLAGDKIEFALSKSESHNESNLLIELYRTHRFRMDTFTTKATITKMETDYMKGYVQIPDKAKDGVYVLKAFAKTWYGKSRILKSQKLKVKSVGMQRMSRWWSKSSGIVVSYLRSIHPTKLQIRTLFELKKEKEELEIRIIDRQSGKEIEVVKNLAVAAAGFDKNSRKFTCQGSGRKEKCSNFVYAHLNGLHLHYFVEVYYKNRLIFRSIDYNKRKWFDSISVEKSEGDGSIQAVFPSTFGIKDLNAFSIKVMNPETGDIIKEVRQFKSSNVKISKSKYIVPLEIVYPYYTVGIYYNVGDLLVFKSGEYGSRPDPNVKLLVRDELQRILTDEDEFVHTRSSAKPKESDPTNVNVPDNADNFDADNSDNEEIVAEDNIEDGRLRNSEEEAEANRIIQETLLKINTNLNTYKEGAHQITEEAEKRINDEKEQLQILMGFMIRELPNLPDYLHAIVHGELEKVRYWMEEKKWYQSSELISETFFFIFWPCEVPKPFGVPFKCTSVADVDSRMKIAEYYLHNLIWADKEDMLLKIVNDSLLIMSWFNNLDLDKVNHSFLVNLIYTSASFCPLDTVKLYYEKIGPHTNMDDSDLKHGILISLLSYNEKDAGGLVYHAKMPFPSPVIPSTNEYRLEILEYFLELGADLLANDMELLDLVIQNDNKVMFEAFMKDERVIEFLKDAFGQTDIEFNKADTMKNMLMLRIIFGYSDENIISKSSPFKKIHDANMEYLDMEGTNRALITADVKEELPPLFAEFYPNDEKKVDKNGISMADYELYGALKGGSLPILRYLVEERWKILENEEYGKIQEYLFEMLRYGLAPVPIEMTDNALHLHTDAVPTRDRGNLLQYLFDLQTNIEYKFRAAIILIMTGYYKVIEKWYHDLQLSDYDNDSLFKYRFALVLAVIYMSQPPEQVYFVLEKEKEFIFSYPNACGIAEFIIDRSALKEMMIINDFDNYDQFVENDLNNDGNKSVTLESRLETLKILLDMEEFDPTYNDNQLVVIAFAQGEKRFLNILYEHPRVPLTEETAENFLSDRLSSESDDSNN